MLRARRWLAGSALLVLVPSSALAQTTELREDLAGIEVERRETEQQLADVRGREGDARARLAAVEDELARAEASLAALEGRLEAARQAVETARVELARARERAAASALRLVAVEGELERAEEELADTRVRLEARIRATFKYGNTSLAEAFVGVRGFDDLVSTTTYVAHVLDADRVLLDEVRRGYEELERHRVQAQVLRAQADEEAAVAALAAADEEAAVLEVEAAAAEQEQLVEAIAARRTERAALFEELRHDRAAIEGHLAGLQAESRRIEAQLAEIARQQEEERRLREAERAAREASEACQAARESGDEDEIAEACGVPEASAGGWVRPVAGRVTSPFGPRWGRNHNGVDLAGDVGTTVVAARAGTVVHVTTGCHPTSSWGCGGGFGNYVTVVHDQGLATVYAHLSAVSVGVGSVVGAGQAVGAVGNSGNSYGPHLHFEVREAGVPRNPCGYISC